MNSLPAVILMLVGLLVGAVAYRRNNTKQLREIQNQVIAVYQAQKAQLEDEIKRLRKENIAMRAAFKQLGVEIEINGDEVVLIQNDLPRPKRTRIMQVHAEQDETPKET